MHTVNLDALSIETMHSGRACLNLTSHINWEDFPDYAKKLLGLLHGSVEKRSDAVDVRIWEVIIENEKFQLTFDDFPVMVSLESLTHKGDSLLCEFKATLTNQDI